MFKNQSVWERQNFKAINHMVTLFTIGDYGNIVVYVDL